MIDQKIRLSRLVGPVVTDEEGSIYGYDQDSILFMEGEPFTRSNGTIIARLYERLTKASRRRGASLFDEQAYRRGIYDAYEALTRELRFHSTERI